MAPEADTQDLRIELADGRRLACLSIGAPDGAAVFYFHGYPGSRLEGRLARAAAHSLGLRLIAPDRPGFGAATFQPGRTIGAWAVDVAELADRLGVERFAVVGVSGGGPYALACAARIPDRITAVALLGGLGPLTSKGATRDMVALNRAALSLARRAPRLARLILAGVVPLVRRRPRRYLARMTAAAPPADRQVLTDPAYLSVFADSTAEALRQGSRGVAWELGLLARPWDFALHDVSVPVDLWQGLADRVVPPSVAHALAASLPRCTSRFLDDEGHFSLIVRHLGAALGCLLRPRGAGGT